jgi:hypothetical protein
MIQTPEFWLIFFLQSFHYGGTLMVINLIEPITIASRVEFRSFFVFIIACSSAIGRISSAHLLQSLSSHSPLTPEHLMGYCCLAVCLLNLFYSLSLSSEVILIVLFSLTGALYGIMGVLSTSSAVSMFGLPHVATNDGVYDLSGAVGAYFIAYGVIALFSSTSPSSDREGESGGGGDAGHCIGPKCYQICFWISSGLCFVGFLLSLLIHRKASS